MYDQWFGKYEIFNILLGRGVMVDEPRPKRGEKFFPQQWQGATIHFVILWGQMNLKMQKTELPSS